MMQEASGEAGRRQVAAPPASPDRTITLLDRNYIINLPSEHPNSPPFSLEPWLKGYYCPFPSVLLAYLKHDGHGTSDETISARYRARLLRHLRRLKESNVIDLDKLEYSILQIRLTNNGLNLIRRSHYSNLMENPPLGIYSLPRRARKERYRALAITARRQMLTLDDRLNISGQFDTYLEDVTNRSVILCLKEQKNNPEAPLYFLPYRTRFTSYERKKGNLDKYEAIWRHSTAAFRSAVFLTLTTDPRIHESSYHANKHFQTALNRLMSLLRKRLGFRPKYLNVHEFTERGLLHSHIIIFGIDYLTHYRELSRIWRQCGQGRIVYIYGLRNNGEHWHWSRARPRDAKKGGTVDLYLKKYLKKALFDPDELFMYWTFNKRFFTYSKSLLPPAPQKTNLGPAYHFIGSAPGDMISITLARRSRSLWLQAKRAEAAAYRGPPLF